MLRRNWATDAELAALKLPILLVAPEIDRWGAGPSLDMARALHARLPGARLEVMKDSGSLILVEDPGRFVDLVNAFYRPLS
jgi:pimeloyl-ACP methyl ester carboxylesterase